MRADTKMMAFLKAIIIKIYNFTYIYSILIKRLSGERTRKIL